MVPFGDGNECQDLEQTKVQKIRSFYAACGLPTMNSPFSEWYLWESNVLTAFWLLAAGD